MTPGAAHNDANKLCFADDEKIFNRHNTVLAME